MASRQLTVGQAFEYLNEELQLRWVAGLSASSRLVTRDKTKGKRPRLLGPLNYNSPNRIQLLGASEVNLYRQQTEIDQERFEYSLTDTCDMMVISDDLEAPQCLVDLAERERIALMTSELDYSSLQSRMRNLLTQQLAEREIIHGVMMDVHGTGVLITGDASVGKSELALELISRGHILVADDAPEFTRIAPGTIECQCPPLLRDFLEVRGLGILNIALMYGDAHTRERKILRFIVHLQPVAVNEAARDLASIAGDRISEPSDTREVLGVNVSRRTLPVAPGRNIAVLVEAAVRDQILRAGGYSASHDLVEKQQLALSRSATRSAAKMSEHGLAKSSTSKPKSGTEKER
ncbi:MAG: HPr(Ser) kinase/phosphatase [Granulosicoccus sp.]